MSDATGSLSMTWKTTEPKSYTLSQRHVLAASQLFRGEVDDSRFSTPKDVIIDVQLHGLNEETSISFGFIHRDFTSCYHLSVRASLSIPQSLSLRCSTTPCHRTGSSWDYQAIPTLPQLHPLTDTCYRSEDCKSMTDEDLRHSVVVADWPSWRTQCHNCRCHVTAQDDCLSRI